MTKRNIKQKKIKIRVVHHSIIIKNLSVSLKVYVNRLRVS